MEPEEKEPSKETPPESSPEGTDLEFEEPDFGAITDFVDSDGEEEVEVLDVTPTEEPEVKPGEEIPPEVPAPIEEGESEEKPPEGEEKPEEKVEPEAKPEEKETAPVEKPEVLEPVKVPTTDELEGMYKEHREKTLPQLEKIFALTDEEAAALDERPSQVVPKLAGQLMYDTMLSTYNAVIAALPSVITTFIEASKQADTAQGKFFEAWPQLVGQKAAVPVISAAIHAYRGQNPRADLDDIIKNAGVMAMVNLGLDPLKVVEEKKPPVVKKVPVKPVAPHGTSEIVPPVKSGDEEDNIFGKLTDAIIAEQS